MENFYIIVKMIQELNIEKEILLQRVKDPIENNIIFKNNKHFY